ncbi:serine hydrolase [Polaribacter batillariae]|uniref:Serine hydrolase n=1 Tax=Polaribacter batillariae TaxID=2808900 RepID=A0ABX7SZ43_9FLAO|nr:DUF5694 domain-containing protein [Polaribacter batillariae]QTD38069.1 serine hydrolase [Polaribacter batillariae]
MMKLIIILFLPLVVMTFQFSLGQVGIVDQEAKSKPEIAIIGNYHMGNQGNNVFKDSYDDILSHERERELKVLINNLKEFKPTKIMVEVDVKHDSLIQSRYIKYLNGEFELKRNEVYEIGFRLAKIMDHKRTQANAAGSLYTTVNDYSKFLRHLLNLSSKKSPITELLFEPSVRITSKTQFGYQAWEDTNQNDAVELSYGLGFGILNTPYGKAVFKEGHDNGFQHYFILFPAEQKGVLLMSNSDNAESTFKKLLELTIGDTYTPWRWQRYTPYDHRS